MQNSCFVLIVLLSLLSFCQCYYVGKHLRELIKSYDPSVPPSLDPIDELVSKDATDVKVNIYLNSISSIDVTHMEFVADMYLRQEWTDSRLSWNSTMPRLLILNRLDAIARVWKPDLYFKNVKKSDFHEVTAPNIFLALNKKGDILFSMRVTLTLGCNMQLVSYPMDTQTCYIRMASYAYPQSALNFLWNSHAVTVDKNLMISEFRLACVTPIMTQCIDQYQGIGNFSCLEVELKLERQYGFHIIQSFMPTILIVMISWVSFWLDPSAIPARVSLGLTTLLTLMTTASGIRSQLPPVSYIKAIDLWVGMCIVYVFGALLEFILVNFLYRKNIRDRQTFVLRFKSMLGRRGGQQPDPDNVQGGEAPNVPQDAGLPPTMKPLSTNRWARIVDQTCRALFPISFVAFNAFYWPYFINFHK